MNLFRRGFLSVNQLAYENAVRPLVFRLPAQAAHERVLRWLSWLDVSPVWCAMLGGIHRLAFENHLLKVGGVTLSSPLILAAGMVKGEGFATESEALAAVRAGRNIIPGWRSVPRLVGLVEFGSFTRYPRLGNLGTVMWRDEPGRSTQNRVGLKNPGAVGAAAFLARHCGDLPQQFGINIAASPGVDDVDQQQAEVLEAAQAFLDQGVYPTWLTLNLSCPNTEDDPTGHQTEIQTRQLCAALVEYIQGRQLIIPVWVKVSPGLAAEQYRILMRVFHEVGVSAVIATNTLGQPAPDDPSLTAGIGGRKLHPCALDAVQALVHEKTRGGYAVDVIGCGGALDGQSYQDFLGAGAAAVQYWSALIYRGPLAAAEMQNELKHG